MKLQKGDLLSKHRLEIQKLCVLTLELNAEIKKLKQRLEQSKISRAASSVPLLPDGEQHFASARLLQTRVSQQIIAEATQGPQRHSYPMWGMRKALMPKSYWTDDRRVRQVGIHNFSSEPTGLKEASPSSSNEQILPIAVELSQLCREEVACLKARLDGRIDTLAGLESLLRDARARELSEEINRLEREVAFDAFEGGDKVQ